MNRWIVGVLICATCCAFAVDAWAQEGRPADEGWIRIDLWERKLYLMEKDKVKESFPVGIGKEKYPTPIGTWQVTNKSRDWGGGFGTRWIGLNVPWGLYGIHGTNRPDSVGSHASHGCIRMLNHDVERLYHQVLPGMWVRIDGPIFGRESWSLKTLVRGDRGTLVMLVQNRLRAAGYYKGTIDGIFGFQLESAIKRYQQDHQLEMTGQIKTVEYHRLGLWE